MLKIISQIISFLSDAVSVTRVRNVPGERTFHNVELQTKHRAYMSGLAWTLFGKPGGLYYVRYRNTFPDNKAGRWNAFAPPAILLMGAYLGY